jgi:Fur family ferric uptake transcriptional regulator
MAGIYSRASRLEPFHRIVRTMSDAELLRERGLRVTAGRLAVLRIAGERDHADAATIVAAVRGRLGSASTQAVYDTLATLTNVGLLRRIEPPGSPARYETRVGDNHHHLICRTCRRIVDVDCATGEAPCLHPSDEHGFAIDEAEVVFWGQCDACRSAAARLIAPAR